ncbi:MAG TPA: DoxX family protein [Nitrososphaerales archaeon]|nr:DoxX family protein [Nitrososphaerales archaeon]
MSGLLEVLNPYGPELLLILRLGVGAGLVLHGYPKAKGGRVQAGQWLKNMGIPHLAADLVTVLEFLGGVFLILGLLTPLVGLFFVVQFGSIIWMKKSKMHASFVSTEQGKPTYEIDAVYLLLALVFLVLGAGSFSLDSLLGL